MSTAEDNISKCRAEQDAESSTADNNNASTCAACGRDGDDLKICSGCKIVKYCNAKCKKKHRGKHKKKCQRRAAELHDEALFKPPPPRNECPICFLPLPLDPTRTVHQSCCGKRICSGCVHGQLATGDCHLSCPFCRTPTHADDEELVERLKKRGEAGDAVAIYNLGLFYDRGERGLPHNHDKAIELWLRAGGLGYAAAHCHIAIAHINGDGVEMDVKKANHYFELAAMGGNVESRHNLGIFEMRERDDMDRAMKHFMISACAGFDNSLAAIREGYLDRLVTKDDFEKALRAHKDANDETRSDQRETAAAFFK